jgi:hypothetical protein
MSVERLLQCYKSPFPKRRFGPRKDGGYVLANVPNAPYKVLLSGGIGGSIDFEIDFLNTYPNTRCAAFDGTVRTIPAKHDRLVFIQKNIGPTDTQDTANLHAVLSQNKGVVIKMDIEGSEFDWIKSLTDEHLNVCEQIVIEIHQHTFNKEEFNTIERFLTHHRLIHFHPNNCVPAQIVDGIPIPAVFECTFLHKKYWSSPPELNTDLIPGPLDFPSVPFNKDIQINYPPFVHTVL